MSLLVYYVICVICISKKLKYLKNEVFVYISNIYWDLSAQLFSLVASDQYLLRSLTHPLLSVRVAMWPMGSSGNKLSKFARQDSSRNRHRSPQDSDDDCDYNVEEENWLCNHYKRCCHVRFPCCNKYWPCHRCHNNDSNCDKQKPKFVNTKFVKCVKCGTGQEVCA